MGPSISTYPEWKAPVEDGQILVWPAAGEILADTITNQKSLAAAQVQIQNLPLSEVRRETRELLGHDHARPLIVDGHQTELYHPGVWVKSVLADAIASRLSAVALHLAVDTDAPKHLVLRWIGGNKPITDDPRINTAHWCGLLKAPSPAHVEQLKRDTAVPTVQRFLDLLPQTADLSSAIMQASHALDMELGIKDQVALASPLWEGRGFLVFVHHIAARAREFASAYNAALAEYRREKRIRTATRPMPDLAELETSVELPLWLDHLQTGQRTRPSVFVAEGGYLISLASGEEFHFDAAADGFGAADRLAEWLKQNHLRFSPRALVLTMFVRLCLADQFVHGIGGARYDQVTDRLIANFFGISPPRFCVTTATMYLPEAVGQQQTCVACIERDGHKLRHSALGDAKQPYLQRIAAAPRHSPQRYEAFTQMHRDLATAVRTNPSIQQWQRQLEEAQSREAAEAVIFDRELFYALQPRERLQHMIDRYSEQFASSTT